jgi:hypothetical protein
VLEAAAAAHPQIPNHQKTDQDQSSKSRQLAAPQKDGYPQY